MIARSTISAALACVLVFQFGCQSEDLECESGYCGHAIIVTGAAVTTLFPPAIEDHTDFVLAKLIFQPLTEIGFDLNTTDPSTFEPRIASSWTSEDSLTLVLNIDPSARWHDGAPVTAHDVAFTYSVYAHPANEGPYTSSLRSIRSVTARNDSTVVFRFNRAHREQLYTASYHMLIMPQHLLGSLSLDSIAADSFWQNPIGSGPYRFVAWNPEVSIEIEADTTFFLGRPGLPRMTWRFGSDPNTRMTLLLSEQADILSVMPSPEHVNTAREADHLQVVPYPGNYFGTITFNHVDRETRTRPHPVLGDPVVRQAIAMAVDRDQVARTVQGDLASAPDNPLTPVSRIYRDEGFEWPYNLDSAKAVLDAANYQDTNGDGIRDRDRQELSFEMIFSASSTPRRTAATVLSSLLAQVGIRATPVPVERSESYALQASGDFDSYLTTWNLQPSPAGIPGLWRSDGSQNYGKYSNPTVDSLMTLAINETDQQRELDYWGQAFDEMNRDVAALWTYQPANHAAIHARFDNVTIRPDLWGATMWQWRVRDGEWLGRDIDPLH